MDRLSRKFNMLSHFSEITFGFLTRHHDYDIEELARKNNLSTIIKLNQIHSNKVHLIPASYDPYTLREGDSLISNTKGIGLGIYTADCLPILLFDRHNVVVSAVHAGWKGSLLNVLGETLFKMKSNFNSIPQHIYAVIGPSIGSCCYEISDDVVVKFVEKYSRTDSFIYSANGARYVLDLKRLNTEILKNFGVEKIEIIDSCTKCDPNYYSYRREGKGVGSQLSFIGLTI